MSDELEEVHDRMVKPNFVWSGTVLPLCSKGAFDSSAVVHNAI